MHNLNKDLDPYIVGGKEISIVDIAMYNYVKSILELTKKSEVTEGKVQRWMEIIEERDGIEELND